MALGFGQMRKYIHFNDSRLWLGEENVWLLEINSTDFLPHYQHHSVCFKELPGGTSTLDHHTHSPRTSTNCSDRFLCSVSLHLLRSLFSKLLEVIQKQTANIGPHCPKCICSHLVSEAQQSQVWLVLGQEKQTGEMILLRYWQRVYISRIRLDSSINNHHCFRKLHLWDQKGNPMFLNCYIHHTYTGLTYMCNGSNSSILISWVQEFEQEVYTKNRFRHH